MISRGSRIAVGDEALAGIVRYVGPARLDGDLEVWIGMELDFPLASSALAPRNALCGGLGDGMVNEMRYFTCPPHKALFFRRADLALVLTGANGKNPLVAKAIKVQTCWRRFAAKKRVRAVVASHTWNVLDTHFEELGLQRGAAVLRAQQQLQRQEQQVNITHEEDPARRTLDLVKREVNELTLESLQAIRVAKEYEGPHLRFPLTLDTVKSMMEDFKNNPDSVLHYRYLMSLFLQSKELFSNEDNVQAINLDEFDSSIVIVGDIHGQIQDLFTIFALQGLPSKETKFLFNGDFVDRGANGCEVLAVLCALKILFPRSVFLNRGNHEARAQNAWMGFDEEILTKYSMPVVTAHKDARAALRVHVLCGLLFDALPLCAIIQRRVFVCHGGLFRNDGVTLHHLNQISRKREPPLNGRSFEDRVFEDLLWSDPRPTPHYPRTLQGRRSSDRGAGCEFGAQITAQFCKVNQIALVVRSHECVPEGFEVLHDGRLITIFSASRYCGTQTNKGAYILLQSDLQPQVHQFYAQTQACLFITEEERQSALEADAIQMMIEQIVDHKVDLYWYFVRNDFQGTGLVSRLEWANALTNVLGLDLPYLYYQRNIADLVEEGGGINYSKFLARYSIRGREKEDRSWQNDILSRLSARLFTLFGSVDKAWKSKFAADEHVTRVDSFTFVARLKSLDAGLTDMQLYEVINTVDSNHDVHIDFAEFQAEFGPYMTKLEVTTTSTAGSNEKWKQSIVQHVSNVLFQLRVHVRAAFRNFFDCDNFGRIPATEFQAGLKAFNDTMQNAPLTMMQIEELTRALQDDEGFISYQEFFDSLTIVDHHEVAPQQLVRKSSSFYFQQVERNDKMDKLVMSKKNAAAAKARQSSSSSSDEDEVVTAVDY